MCHAENYDSQADDEHALKLAQASVLLACKSPDCNAVDACWNGLHTAEPALDVLTVRKPRSMFRSRPSSFYS